MPTVTVIGGGLAGCEAAYYLALHGIKVELYDIKPSAKTPAHSSDSLGELVCSNSLKSGDIYSSASGLLKEEMRLLKSLIIEAADNSKVPAGAALAVDREKFSSYLTNKVLNHTNITFITKEITEIDLTNPTVIATGPLTTDALFENISKITGGRQYFYDASAPIVDFDSIDMNFAFYGGRYDQAKDYINCPLNKDEYYDFVNALITAETVPLKDFEKQIYFEGCMPIEALAKRGKDTLRYGVLKPKGLDDPKTGRYPFACLQLRAESNNKSAYNLVGFQTNLKFGEQRRVFSMIKALNNAECLRYGVMHRNSYINSPKVLNADFSLKNYPLIFFGGQITGVEGYVESAASGLMCGINLCRKLHNLAPINFGGTTIMGALARHISTESDNFQPMNANFGILDNLEKVPRDKKQKKEQLSKRALERVNNILTGEL